MDATTNTQAGQKPRKKAGRKPRAKDMTMTRRDLASLIHAKLGRRCTTQTALEVVQTALDCMGEALIKGRYIEFRDFGVFAVLKRRSRLGRNPNDPTATVIIPERRSIKFKPSRNLLKRLADANAPVSAEAARI